MRAAQPARHPAPIVGSGGETYHSTQSSLRHDDSQLQMLLAGRGVATCEPKDRVCIATSVGEKGEGLVDRR